MNASPRILLCSRDRRLLLALASLCGAVTSVRHGWQLLEALAASAYDPYDLIAVDAEGPGPDGLQLAAMARTAGIDTPFLFAVRMWDRRLDHCHPVLQPAACLARPIVVQDAIACARAFLPSTRRSHAS